MYGSHSRTGGNRTPRYHGHGPPPAAPHLQPRTLRKTCMSDFYQHGTIATLHRLGEPDMREMERALAATAAERPMTLVLPSLYSELEGAALKGIVQELAQVPYLSEIVISM